MAESTERTKSSGNDRFDAVRREFDKLELNDKALFLVEAAFTTAGKAVDEAGRSLSEIIESISRAWEPQPGGEKRGDASSTAGAANMN